MKITLTFHFVNEGYAQAHWVLLNVLNGEFGSANHEVSCEDTIPYTPAYQALSESHCGYVLLCARV